MLLHMSNDFFAMNMRGFDIGAKESLALGGSDWGSQGNGENFTAATCDMSSGGRVLFPYVHESLYLG